VDAIDKRFDVVIALSFIYLLDEANLRLFFTRMAETLAPGGVLLLDSPGAPDAPLGNFWHGVCLPIEAHLVRPALSLYRRMRGRPHVVVETKHHGFRYKSAEIIQLAAGAGFHLEAFEPMDFENEWSRSIVYRYLLQRVAPIRRVFLMLGRRMPYVRMYALRKPLHRT